VINAIYQLLRATLAKINKISMEGIFDHSVPGEGHPTQLSIDRPCDVHGCVKV
jgi:hypothetical protein